MKARLKIKSIVLILLVMVRYTEGLTWNTEMRSAVCCQGNNQLLIFNFTKGENEKVTGLHWYFNEKTLVCLESSTITGFVVGDLYEGRVERNGTAGILLKNVSLNDAGEYTLYVKLDGETKRNVQGINLTVVEPPPSQCKPIIKKEHPLGIISCSTACERSPLSVDWIINGEKDPEVFGHYLVVNPLSTSEQPICCLRDFKCVDNYQMKFCTPNHFSFTKDTNCMVYNPILIILAIAVVVLIVVVITMCCLNRGRCKSFEPMPVHPVTGAQHKKDHQQDPTIAATTDQPIQDSNQLDQIVNNNSSATDFLQNIILSNKALRAELEASKEEIMKLKRLLHLKTDEEGDKYSFETKRGKCSDFTNKIMKLKRELRLETDEKGDKYSFEMAELKRSDFMNNDTDSFKTSESEDDSSELPSAPMLPQGYPLYSS